MLMRREQLDLAFPLGMAQGGERVKIIAIDGGKQLMRRLIPMGLVEGIEIEVLHWLKGCGVVIARGETRLALGAGMAHKIMVVPL